MPFTRFRFCFSHSWYVLLVGEGNLKTCSWLFYLGDNCILCEIFLTLHRFAHAESPNGQMVGWAHKYKRRYCTLWFWRSENLASSKIRRRQSNGKRSTWCLYASYVLCAIMASQASVVNIHRCGAFSVARFRRIGQCESLQNVERAAGLAPRFLFYVITLRN